MYKKEPYYRSATREMRWNQIIRAAVILGLCKGRRKRDSMHIAAMLDARVKAGKVIKRKTGKAQSAPAYYRALLPRSAA